MSEPLEGAKPANRLSSIHRRVQVVMMSVVAVAGLIPVAMYLAVLGRVPTVSAARAEHLFATGSSNVVLVDVRPAEEYRAGHLPAAVSWPLDNIREMRGKEDLPPSLEGKNMSMVLAPSKPGKKKTESESAAEEII